MTGDHDSSREWREKDRQRREAAFQRWESLPERALRRSKERTIDLGDRVVGGIVGAWSEAAGHIRGLGRADDSRDGSTSRLWRRD